MKNAEWMIKNGYKFSDLYAYGKYNVDGVWIWSIQHLKAGIDEMSHEQAHDNVITAWLDEEHKEPILDDAERAYLSAVIRPFRDNVKLIAKGDDFDKSYIFITFVNDADSTMFFPYFKKGTMYKGMSNKMYTPEELGL